MYIKKSSTFFFTNFDITHQTKVLSQFLLKIYVILARLYICKTKEEEKRLYL